MNIRDILDYILDANDLTRPDELEPEYNGLNEVPENIEYLRGQVEMLRHIMGYVDDGHDEDSFILGMLGLEPNVLLPDDVFMR